MKIKHLLVTLLISSYSLSAQAKEHILMVISGYGSQTEASSSKNKYGYEFGEFAKAYLTFTHNNVDLDVASPQGGKVEPTKFNPNTAFNQAVLNNPQAMKALENSIAFANVNPEQYDGVFVVGGSGAMFDLPENKSLQNIIKKVYEQNGSVAAVCHGPAALVNVKLSNNEYLVANRKVNSFTNSEENTLNEDAINEFGFLLESKLVERGAHFESSPLLMSHSVTDQRLITGQNQHSTGETAIDLLRSIGVQNIQALTFKDEATMALIERYLSGDNSAINDFHQSPNNYLPELIAQYANVYGRKAQDKQTIEKSVALMEMAMQHWQHPRLSLALAQNLIKLERLPQAKAVVKDVLESQSPLPEKVIRKAQKLLNKIQASEQQHILG